MSPPGDDRTASGQLARDIVAVEPGGLKHGAVAAKALAQRKFDVALEPRPGRGEMVLTRALARAEHCRPRTRRPQPLIGEQGLIEIVGMTCDRRGEHAGILDR